MTNTSSGADFWGGDGAGDGSHAASRVMQLMNMMINISLLLIEMSRMARIVPLPRRVSFLFFWRVPTPGN